MKNNHCQTTVAQAGRRGGLKTLQLHGKTHFQQIGKKGGLRTKELYGHLFSEYGRKGGRPERPKLDFGSTS